MYSKNKIFPTKNTDFDTFLARSKNFTGKYVTTFSPDFVVHIEEYKLYSTGSEMNIRKVENLKEGKPGLIKFLSSELITLSDNLEQTA